MINRELQEVIVKHLVSTKDEYGQPRLQYDFCFFEEMLVKKQNNAVIPAPTYLNVDYLALSKHFEIDANYLLTINGINYRVKYTLPSKKFNQLFLSVTNENPTEVVEQ